MNDRSQHQPIALMDILYGLAIATGFEKAMERRPCIFEGDVLLGFLTFGAVLLALSDWAVYHYVASVKQYGCIRRFLFDLVFPFLLFLAFLALPNAACFAFLVLIYFVASFLYMVVLGALPETKRNPLLAATIVASLCALVGFLRAREGLAGTGWAIWTMVAVLLWAAINGALIDWHFRGRPAARLFSPGHGLFK